MTNPNELIRQRLLAYQLQHGLGEAGLLRRINSSSEAFLLLDELRIFLTHGLIKSDMLDAIQRFLDDANRPVEPDIPSVEPIPAYDPDERAIIRQKVQAFKDDKKLSIAKLSARIFGFEVTEAESKAVERFLAAKIHVGDHYVHRIAEFAAPLDYPDPAFEMGIALTRLYLLSGTLPVPRARITIEVMLNGDLLRGKEKFNYADTEVNEYPGQHFAGLRYENDAGHAYDGVLLNTKSGYVAALRERLTSALDFICTNVDGRGFILREDVMTRNKAMITAKIGFRTQNNE